VPYYIYKISEHPIRRLEKLEQHAAYRDASASARKMRSELPEDVEYSIKIVFGETELHAEDALNQVREPSLEPDE
jgi:hypothetical protein